MLKNITWLQYFIAVLIILVPYYGYLLFRYYRSKLLNRPRLQANVNYEDSQQYDDDSGQPDFDSIPEDLFMQAQELIAKLKQLIGRVAAEGIDKKELLVNIKSFLDDYPALNTDAFRPAINEMVIVECDRNSSVSLVESEVDGLW